MLALKTLIVTALPLLVSGSTFQRGSHHNIRPHFSPVLDSLQCYNDFTTHIRCTWEEDLQTPLHLPVVSVNTGDSPCVPDGHSALLPSGKAFHSCLYKTQIFTLGSYTVFFNASCPSKGTVLKVAQQGKVLSPVNLTVGEAAGGGRELRWSCPYSSSSCHQLTYQLKYRRHRHDWTVVNNTSSSELVIEKTALLPGYLYEARVRARGGFGLWSDWSRPVTWMTEEEAVLNLQCVLVEKGLMCSWQVKREHAQIFSYNLCWRTDRDPSQTCEHCSTPAGAVQPTEALLDFSCSLVTSRPELLTVEIQKVHASKTFSYPSNFQPPCPPTVHVDNSDGIWKVRWSKPKVSDKAQLYYQVCVRRNDTQTAEECYNITDIVYSFDLPHTFLLPNTRYTAQVQALPGDGFAGRPSDWSQPVHFTTNSAPWTNTIIYIIIVLFTFMVSVLLYNALPACHRRFEMWDVSIPSPIKSRVLEEMSSRKLPVGWTYSPNEKTSVCIVQSTDPIIYKGRILEYPLMPYVDNSSGNITLLKTDWTHCSPGSASTEGSRMTDRSAMSFLGPYILCHQESLSQTESSNTSFSSLSSFDEENASVSSSTSDSTPVKEGYVFSPPTFLPSTHDPTSSVPPSGEPSHTEIPNLGPPAYSCSPAGMPSVIFPHPSGYCLMPQMNLSAKVWEENSGMGNQSSKTTEVDEHACSYVTLSHPGI